MLRVVLPDELRVLHADAHATHLFGGRIVEGHVGGRLGVVHLYDWRVVRPSVLGIFGGLLFP